MAWLGWFQIAPALGFPTIGPAAMVNRVFVFHSNPGAWIGWTHAVEEEPEHLRPLHRAGAAGGALVQLSVFFADVRGFTSLAERMSSMETTILLNRFYEASSAALLSQEAVLGQIAGDEVMALFVPGLAGSGYQAKAVEAGRSLLRALGYGTAEGNWVDVGVGICSGEEYVGNVGGGGFKDFTALGDVTNTAARVQAAPGEARSSYVPPPTRRCGTGI